MWSELADLGEVSYGEVLGKRSALYIGVTLY